MYGDFSTIFQHLPVLDKTVPKVPNIRHRTEKLNNQEFQKCKTCGMSIRKLIIYISEKSIITSNTGISDFL